NDFKHRRMNPICAQATPVVVIKNNGGAPLTSLKIDYATGDESTGSYTWTGNLKFLQTAEVSLPGIDLGSGPGTFSVTVSQPNGQPDEYAPNNMMNSAYTVPKVVKSPVTFAMRTDDFGGYAETTNGITYEVRDLD